MLITGATGFIGGRLASRASDHGWRVRTLARRGIRYTASTPVSIMLDDNDKKATSVYRDRLYQEINKMKKKANK